MKIQIPLNLRLLNDSKTYFEEEAPVLCDYLLHAFFSFPQDTPQITITISTEPMDDSYEVKRPESGNALEIHHDGDWNYTMMFHTAKKHIINLCEKGNVKTLFVSLEY